MAFHRSAIAVLLFAVAVSAQVAAPKAAVSSTRKAFPNAYEALQGRGLTLFAKLAEVAGLDPYLESNYTRATIFAPSNAAILKLATAMKTTPEGLIAEHHHLLVDRLVGYHIVVGANHNSKAVTNGKTFKSVGRSGDLTAVVTPAALGRPATVSIKGAQNTAKVTGADITGGNVTIHIIDSVLLPPTVFPTIKAALAFSPTAAGLGKLLAADPALSKAIADPATNITLLMPTSSALDALKDAPDAAPLLKDTAALNRVLSYHAIKGAYLMPPYKLRPGANDSLPTLLDGANVLVIKKITPKAGGNVGQMFVQSTAPGAAPIAVRKHNIIAGASYINVIDGVLLPPPAAAAAAAPAAAAAAPAAAATSA